MDERIKYCPFCGEELTLMHNIIKNAIVCQYRNQACEIEITTDKLNWKTIGEEKLPIEDTMSIAERESLLKQHEPLDDPCKMQSKPKTTADVLRGK